MRKNKRLNYFQIHPNKKCRKIPKRRLNTKGAQATMIMAMSICQVSVISSQIYKDKALRALEIAKVIIQSAEGINKLFSKKQQYLDRYNYEKNIRLFGKKATIKSFGNFQRKNK